jgi:hypothetical protein
LIWSKAVRVNVEVPFRTKFNLLTTGIAPDESAASFLRARERDEDKADEILLEAAALSKSKSNADSYAEYTGLRGNYVSAF